MSRAAHPAHSTPSSPRQAGRHPQPFPVASPGKAAARSQPAQPPAQARQPKYLREALPSLGTATRRRVHMPQQCLIKLPNSKGIPLRLSEDKLGARLLSGNAGTGKEQSSFFFFPFRSRITQSKPWCSLAQCLGFSLKPGRNTNLV